MIRGWRSLPVPVTCPATRNAMCSHSRRVHMSRKTGDRDKQQALVCRPCHNMMSCETPLRVVDKHLHCVMSYVLRVCPARRGSITVSCRRQNICAARQARPSAVAASARARRGGGVYRPSAPGNAARGGAQRSVTNETAWRNVGSIRTME